MEAARLGVNVDDRVSGADAPVPPPVAAELKSKARQVAVAASSFVRAAGQLSSDPSNQLLAHAVTSAADGLTDALRSKEHTSELQSLMRISYAVFCLKKKKNKEN